MIHDNSELGFAFPAMVRNDVIELRSALPHPLLTAYAFPVFVSAELVQIPYRIYHDVTQIDRTRFNDKQIEFLDCLLTRHHNGFIREEHLRKILSNNHPWVPPFVVQLAGEYVIEILSAIRDSIHDLDHDLYRAFLLSNPGFLDLTKRRVESYRNCYYPHLDRNKYVGLEIVRFLDSLIGSRK